MFAFKRRCGISGTPLAVVERYLRKAFIQPGSYFVDSRDTKKGYRLRLFGVENSEYFRSRNLTEDWVTQNSIDQAANIREGHPQEVEPQPPFPEQQQEIPGQEKDLQPQADHGEQSYRGHGRLAGKVALITGADSGIGRAVALAFAREGADVAISYLSEDNDAVETARLVEEAGHRALTIAGDISDEEHCRQLVRQTYDELGSIDILVNNAAFQKNHEDIAEITADELQHTFATNIFSMFYLSRECLSRMEPGSSIINTTSIQAFDPSPTLLAYAATKGAIANFSKGLAKMVADRGIRVNAVAPGPVWTPLIPTTLPVEDVKEFGQDSAMKRPAQPAELAPLYVFLASSEASYVTGEVYSATGGQSPV